MKRYCGAMLMCAAVATAAPLQARAAGGGDLSLDLRQNVVRVTATWKNGAAYDGFGFVVGDRAGTLYVVTADHVVRGDGPDAIDQSPRVAFFSDQGAEYKAELLGTRLAPAEGDIAILRLRAPAGLAWRRPAVARGRTQRGASVWFIGLQRDWYVPTQPGSVNRVVPSRVIVADGLNVRVGTSGAPLISEAGIIGMVIADAETFVRASPIDLIERAVKDWGYPWDLTPVVPAASAPGPAPPASPAASPGNVPQAPPIAATPKVEAAPLAHVIPSRAFLGPHDIPPQQFAAYGIVAFPQRSTPQTERRHISICQGFLASLPDASEIATPPSDQMVTVWPVESESVAAGLSRSRMTGSICPLAVARYHLPSALVALREAKTDKSINLSGEGPYLLAWAPSSEKGKSSAIVLIYDLSNNVTPEQYAASFRAWRNDIERKPELWRHGWSVAALRNAIRNWADRWGSVFLSIGQAKE